MTFRMNTRDVEILKEIAEYRVLTVGQLAGIMRKNSRALRRRLGKLERESLIRIDPHVFSKKQGRPEGLVSIRKKGIDLLKDKSQLGAEVPVERAMGKDIRCLEHQLLTNDFRAQLVQVERIVPETHTRFLSPMSPFLERSPEDHPLVQERFPIPDNPEKWVKFTPDGVFALTEVQSGKTLQFFLEVDMGTETRASKSRENADIRQKILNYQLMYYVGRYKHYEKTWDCSLSGFRLLFLANSRKRLKALCELVRAMGPTDFVYLTDQEQLYEQGVWASIWYEGGQMDALPVSILGSKMPAASPCPQDILK